MKTISEFKGNQTTMAFDADTGSFISQRLEHSFLATLPRAEVVSLVPVMQSNAPVEFKRAA